MPFAVTHILIPIIIFALYRDFFAKNKKTFSLHYVLIAGFGGVLPDVDIIISVFLNFIGIQDWNLHKTFAHSLFFPLIFFLAFIILKPANIKTRICNIGRHKLKLSTIFLALSLGVLIHILLDSVFGEMAFFFYPFSAIDYGINIISYLPKGLQGLAFPLMDGILLVVWLLYLELKHKISDFI